MGTSRILVVDDDPNTVDTMRDILGRANFEVDTAATGREALHKLINANTQPAVIILDIRMPVMDGAEFLTIVRAYHRLSSIPVIVLTAFDADEAPTPPPPPEISMRKPFCAEELVANVQSLAGKGVPRDAQ